MRQTALLSLKLSDANLFRRRRQADDGDAAGATATNRPEIMAYYQTWLQSYDGWSSPGPRIPMVWKRRHPIFDAAFGQVMAPA